MTTADARLRDELLGEFVRRHPVEASRAIERLPAEQSRQPLEVIPLARAVEVFDRLNPESAARILRRLSPDRSSEVLARMEPGRATSLLLWFDPADREQYLARLPPAAARDLKGLVQYPSDSAGRLMDPRVVMVHPDATVREVLARLRRSRRRSIGAVPVVDEDGRLTGLVPIREVAVAPLTSRIGSLPSDVPATVTAMATRSEVTERLADQPTTSLPVVDLAGRLLGIIRPETVLSIVQEDAGADLQAMVGVSREERALSSVSFAVKKRLPWLHINLLTAFLAAAVVGLFEDTIAKFTALAVLLPVVAGQSGNTGAQALAVVMRGLALREVTLRQWLRVVLKESNVALLNGVAVALTTALGVFVWSQSTGLALVIATAMVISMAAAGLAGAMIPILLTAANQDPAQASSIILTTVTDIVGFMSFLGLATLLAGML